jgi:hypothetical protein
VLLPHCDEPILDAREAVGEMQKGAAEVIAVIMKKLRVESDAEAEGFMAAGLIGVQNELSVGLPQYWRGVISKRDYPDCADIQEQNRDRGLCQNVGVLARVKKWRCRTRRAHPILR